MGVQSALRCVASAVQFVSHSIPAFICRTVPHAHAGLSLASLYLFLQALGLLWFFMVSLLAVSCTRMLTSLVDVDMGAPLVVHPLRTLAVGYVYYSVMRVISLVAQSMWIVGWELYHNFPTMRRMLMSTLSRREDSADKDKGISFGIEAEQNGGVQNGSATQNGGTTLLEKTGVVPSPLRERKVTSTNSEPALLSASNPVRSDDSNAAGSRGRPGTKAVVVPPLTQLEQRTQNHPFHSARAASPGGTARDTVRYSERRQIVMLAPLVVLMLMNLIMVAGQYVCDGQRKTMGEAGILCSESGGLWNPTSRVNRSCRFVLFVALLQWAQIWVGLFPQWYAAIACSDRSTGRRGLCLLLPLSLARFAIWIVRPAGSGVVYFFSGVRHHILDTLLVAVWSVWLLIVACDLMRPKALALAGFSTLFVRDYSVWKAECTLFKFTIFFWQLLHFIRGCLSLGPAYAQNDLIAISLLYPVLLCVVWTLTFVVVAMSHFGHMEAPVMAWMGVLAGAGLLLIVAYEFCNWVERAELPGLVLCVWVHFCRQGFRVLRRLVRAVRHSPSGVFMKYAVAPQSNEELSSTYQFERKLLRIAVRSLVLIMASFLAVLATCILIAGVQQRQGLFLNDIVWWERHGNHGLRITNSRASILNLNFTSYHGVLSNGSDVLMPEETPHYAVCGHTWYGLQLVDYALMNEVAYMDEKPENDLQGLLTSLFPHMEVKLIHAASAPRRWIEVEVNTCKPADYRLRGKQGGNGCHIVTVIAVSGTDPTRVVDYAENLRMWTEPVALKILSTVFPTIRIWPRDTTAMVIAATHKILKSMAVQDEKWHYREILDHVRRLPAEREVVVAGHSLGGGIALVVGALTGRLGVAFQPPGVYHSLAKHQAQQHSKSGNALHRRSVSVVFEGDWIQNFDEHGGLVQTMTCDQSARSIAVGCHLLEGAIAHLLWHCGDKAHRFVSCTHDYHPTSTALNIAKSVLEIMRESWTLSSIYAHMDSILIAGATVSGLMVLRHGALPRQASSRWAAAQAYASAIY